MARVLPRDEYPRLAGTEAEQVWPALQPSDRVVVIERDGQIIACHVLMQIWHVECLWKAPTAGLGVLRQLFRAVRDEAQRMGIAAVLTGAQTDVVRRIVRHEGGTPIEADTFVVPIAKG